MKKIRLNIYLGEYQYQLLKRRAAESGASMSSCVQLAVSVFQGPLDELKLLKSISDKYDISIDDLVKMAVHGSHFPYADE